MAPLLSIYIPTYNRRQYLERLLSTLCRCISDNHVYCTQIEIVIANNASVDDTTETVNAYISKYKSRLIIELHNNKTNIGPVANFIQAGTICRGVYLWLIGDDDLVVEHNLYRVWDQIQARPDVIFLSSVQECESRGQSTDITSGKLALFQRFPITSLAHISRVVLSRELYNSGFGDISRVKPFYVWVTAIPLVYAPDAITVRVIEEPIILMTKDGGTSEWRHKIALPRLAEVAAYCRILSQNDAQRDALFKLNFPSKRQILRNYVAASIVVQDQHSAFSDIDDVLHFFKLQNHPIVCIAKVLRAKAGGRLLLKTAKALFIMLQRG